MSTFAARYYESRHAQPAVPAKACGLGDGECCGVCAKGGDCEGAGAIYRGPNGDGMGLAATAIEYGKRAGAAGSDGVGDLLDIMKEGPHGMGAGAGGAAHPLEEMTLVHDQYATRRLAPRHPGMRGLPGGLGTLPQLQTALSGLQGQQTGDAAASFYASKQAGDTYKTAGDGGQAGAYDSAVDVYKAAAQGSVSSTGVSGELTSADATTTASTYTQQAWAINALLNSSAINSTNSTGTAATQSDAQQAQGYVTQMLNFYIKGAQAAIAANQAPSPPGPPPAPTPAPIVPSPTPAATSASTNYTKPILVSAGLLGAGLVGWALYKRYGNPLSRSSSRAWTRVPSGRTAHSARTVRP
jgi:hypothetical protein